MLASLAASLGLLAQVAALPVRNAAEPVRVWRADSTVYVALREPGYVTLLHAGPDGRISVLFPLEPDLPAGVAAGTLPLRLALPPNAQGDPSTFVAIRSRWPFDFAALRGGTGPTWDYHDAWLLQPTAGDPLAALLDIADRVTDGRPYDYGAVAYLGEGVVASRRTPRQPEVCLGCVRRAPVAPAAPVAVQTNSVDCSNASLTNSFCGVANGSVSIAGAPAPAPLAYQPPPAAQTIVVPYYVPFFVRGDRRRFAPPALEPPPAAQPAAAFPIAPRLLVPSSTQLRTFTGRRR